MRRGSNRVALGAVIACWGGVYGCGQKFTSCETEPCPSELTGTGGQVGAGGDSANSSSSSTAEAGAPTGEAGAIGGEVGAAGAAGRGSSQDDCAEPCTEACCDGICVDMSWDEAHCGECGNACDLPSAQAVCHDGQCAVRICNEGFLDCNGKPEDGCEEPASGLPLAPVPLQPMIGAFTGSLHARATALTLKPTFTWTPADPTGCGEVSYHVQVDDECPLSGFQTCTMPTPEVDEAGIVGTHFQPAEDLSVEEDTAPLGRRYFWRVRACDEGQAVCSDWSEVRYLDVGRVKEDVNGDGYADILAASGESLWFVPGSADFSSGSTVLARPIAAEDIRLLSGALKLRFVGDVDGDGFNDLAAPGILIGNDSLVSQALVVHGGVSFDEGRAVVIGSERGGSGEVSLHKAGDFNHDGFADLVMSVSGAVPAWLAFHPGGPSIETLVSEDSIWEAPAGAEPNWYGYEVVCGDYNGDGYPDIALSLGRDNKTHLLLGDGLPNFEVDVEFSHAATGGACAPGIIATLNMNGDAFDDLAVLCPAAKQLWVGLGTSNLAQAVEWTAALNHPPQELTIGDLDGDSFDDIYFSGATVFAGGPEPAMFPFIEIESSPEFWSLPAAVADHNSDGYPDLVQEGAWYPGPHQLSPPPPGILSDGTEPLPVRALAR